jgi:subtilisin family serine protease
MKKKWFSSAIIVVLIFLPGVGPAQQASRPRVPPEVRKNIEEKGVSHVTVRLNVPVRIEKLSPSEEARQQNDILATQNALLSQLKGTKHKVIKQYKSGPFIDLEVDQAGLAILEKSPLVKTMTNEANLRYKRMLHQSVPLIGGAAAFLAGYDGSGQTIVIIGTGIDADHPMLDGKVVAEACYQSNFACPNGQHTQFGTGAATTCVEFDDCDHETHVAGVAAGLEVTDPETARTFSGVAKGAQIAAIRISSHDGEGGPGDFYDALDYTYTERSKRVKSGVE